MSNLLFHFGDRVSVSEDAWMRKSEGPITAVNHNTRHSLKAKSTHERPEQTESPSMARHDVPGIVARRLRSARQASGADAKRPRVAAVVTEFTHRSHAHVILENFLEPYYFNGKLTDPGVDVVGLYVDQFPAGATWRASVAKQYKIAIFPTIAEALQLGGKELAVDGVLSIGEHGNYPTNDRGQIMYPRKRFFDEIVAVFRQSGRVVPLFNDKHLSYRWDWAGEMMQVARELKIPFMAGSSVPLAQRRPPLELPAERGDRRSGLDPRRAARKSYDFHALEVLQSMVEARRGGETGRQRDSIARRGRRLAGGRRRTLELRRWPRPRCGPSRARTSGELQELRRAGGRQAASGPRHPDQVPRRPAGDGAADRQQRRRAGTSPAGWRENRSRWRPASTSARGRIAICSRRCRTRFRRTSARSKPRIRSSARTWSPACWPPRWIRASRQHKPLATPHLDIAYQPRDFRACAKWASPGRSSPKTSPSQGHQSRRPEAETETVRCSVRLARNLSHSITIRSRLKRDSNSAPSFVTSTLSMMRAPRRSSPRKTGGSTVTTMPACSV